jgi:hypothetical protein
VAIGWVAVGFIRVGNFLIFFCAATDTNNVKVCAGVTGGSGLVAVVAIDSWEQCGSNGASYKVWLSVLAGW